MKSLRYRIGMSYLALVMVTIAISSFAVYHFYQLGQSLGEILLDNYRNVRAAENMVKALERQEQAQLSMQVGDFVANEAEFERSRKEFYKSYNDALVTGRAIPEKYGILDSIRTAYETYLNTSEELRRQLEAERALEAGIYHSNVVRPLARRLRDHNFRLLEVNQNAMLRMESRVRSVADTAAKAVIAASIVAVFLSLIASLQFGRSITKPITTLTRNVRLIGKGQLNQKIELTSDDDEIAQLGYEFNKMTERLQAFEAMNVQQLVAEKRKSESLVATMPNPVIVTDQNDLILLLNDEAKNVLGVEGQEWAGRRVSEVITQENVARQITTPAPAGEPENTVFDLVAGGESRYFRRRQTVVTDPVLQDTLTVTVLEDVTHFKQVEQMKSDFVAAVSHELRTPLTSLGMALDILLQELVGALNEAQRDLLQTAKVDSERLRKLITDLLNLARLESGAYRPQFEPVDFHVVIEEAVGPLRLPFREKGVFLSVRTGADLPRIIGDGTQLAWAVRNLVGNALRYTPPEGTVTVDAQTDDEWLHVRVIDKGRGIAPEAAATVFDKFVQLKNAEESTPGSVGLGLAIAKLVVELHGGRIWVESQTGAGSTFCFDLPLMSEMADGDYAYESARY